MTAFCESHATRGFKGVRAAKVILGTPMCKPCVDGKSVYAADNVRPKRFDWEAIRRDYALGMTVNRIAKKYGCKVRGVLLNTTDLRRK